MNADDLNFAYKVRHALNEHLDNLPPATALRLAQARQAALARKKPESALLLAGRKLAGPAGIFTIPLLGRLTIAVPILALAFGLAGLYQYEEQQRIAEAAEIDAAVLADELPLTAYLDKGFNAYLEERAQQ